tara:strand:- start:1368 stop:2279 length:912 start_codon:yes stop_codon:yes gene_type:complete
MASILRIDTLQNLAGTTAATLDGNGMLSIAQRFRLPQFAFASLPSSGQSEGELVYDTTNKMLRFWTGQRWLEASKSGGLGESETNPVTNGQELRASGISTAGDYWYQPVGANFSIQCYTNFSSPVASNKAWVLVQRGRESYQAKWAYAGYNYDKLDSSYLTDNGNIAAAPSDWVNNLIGGNVLNTKMLVNRQCVNDSYTFVATSAQSFNWNMCNGGTRPNMNWARYGSFWGAGSASNNDNNTSSWTDTNYGPGNNCGRSFSWQWNSHGGYQGWSTGSTCDPSCGYEYSSENHRIMNAHVYFEC